MSYITKAIGAVACLFLLQSCIINNAKKQECIVKQIVVTQIYATDAADIFSKKPMEIFITSTEVQRGIWT